MLCENCKSQTATTVVKTMINGEYTEHRLCNKCAKELGYDSMLFDMHSDFSSILGSFFSNALPARSAATRCPVCQSTYHDISSSGKVGCAHCYETFLSELMPTISRIHGNTTHCGKTPQALENTENKPTIAMKIDELKAQMQSAVEVQNFELATELRDKIKELEESK